MCFIRPIATWYGVIPLTPDRLPPDQMFIITGEDGRQILFVQLKQGVLAALTDKNVNLGLLRIALHDLLRKAQG